MKAYDARGWLSALDVLYRAGTGELGSDTWPADSDAWETGGGTVWHTPAVDPELGLIYFSTGNPGLTTTAQSGPVTICLQPRLLPLTPILVNTAGTSSRFTTTSGISMRRILLFCSTLDYEGF